MKNRLEEIMNVPNVPDTGGDGSQKASVSGEVLLPTVTENEFPQNEFVGVLTELSNASPRSLGSSAAGPLIAAWGNEILQRNGELEVENRRLSEDIQERDSRISSLEVDVARFREREKGEGRSAVPKAVLPVIGGIIIGVVFLPEDAVLSSKDWILVLAAVACYVIPFVSFLKRRRVSNEPE